MKSTTKIYLPKLCLVVGEDPIDGDLLGGELGLVAQLLAGHHLYMYIMMIMIIDNDDNNGDHLVEDVGAPGDIGRPLLGLELGRLLLLLRHVQVVGPLW